MLRKILDILSLAWNADGYPGWRRLYHPIWLYELFRAQWHEDEYIQVEINEDLWPEEYDAS